MNKITYYNKNGKIENIEDLTEENLGHINGMLTKFTLKNGNNMIGYADPFKSYKEEEYDDKVHDYLYLWTWDNIDEETHQLIGNDAIKYNQTFKRVDINNIEKVDTILYSNPRWGGKLTNKFEL